MIDHHPASIASHGLPARIAGYRATRWGLNALWQMREDVRGMLRAGLYTDAEPLQGIDGIQGNLVHSADSGLEFGFDQSTL